MHITLAKSSALLAYLSFFKLSEYVYVQTPIAGSKLYIFSYEIIVKKIVDKRKAITTSFGTLPFLYLAYIWFLSIAIENDENPVVRIHSAGAIRITKKALNDSEK